MRLQGIIHGKNIELEQEPGLPEGTVVTVNLQPKDLSREEQDRLIDVLCGAWTQDESLSPIFEEIARQRHQTMPR